MLDFFNESIECDILSGEPVRLKEKSNYGQNMLPINLDGNKYRMCEHCTFFIRSELKFKPHENTACAQHYL